MSNGINISFSFKPRKWQQECINRQTRYSVWALHRRAGKTTLALNLLREYAMKKVGTYVYIAPYLKQAKQIAWVGMKEIAKDFQHIAINGRFQDLVTIKESELNLIFWNGSVITLSGADNPDALRGQKLAGAVLDEVAQMPREVWSEVVRMALADSRGWAIFIGTPKGINLFSELFARGDDPNFKPDWSNARYTCYETDALPPEEIEAIKRDSSPEEFKREMLCDFSASTEDQLIPLNVIEKAVERKVDGNMSTRYEVVMGVDVARYGNDESVIALRQGMEVRAFHRYKGLDLVSLAESIATVARANGIKTIYIDGTGVGGGVPDILRAMGVSSFDINFGQKSTEPNYANKRSEMWGKMGQWLLHGSIPRDNQLMKELAAPRYEKDDEGKIKLEPKKKLKERIGFSPDLADALALTFCGWVPEVNESYDQWHKEFWRAPKQDITPVQRFERQAHAKTYSYRRAFKSSIVKGGFF